MATFFIGFYTLFFVSAIPLMLAERWSLAAQCAIALAVVLPWIKKIRLPKSPVNWKVITIITLGIGIQAKSIYYLYATHDPSIYLAQGFHIAKTGTFFDRSEFIKEASSKSDTEMLKLTQLESFGVLRVTASEGKNSFHGFPGAPLFFAITTVLFGENNAILANLLHYLAICVFLVTLFRAWGGNKIEPLLLFFSLCPLVPLIFRMSLSEPLACALFLGMAVCAQDLKSPFHKIGFVSLLAFSLLTRISAVLYLPFAFFFLSNALRLKEKAVTFGVILVALSTSFYFSPHYCLGIFREHLKKFVSFQITDLHLYTLWGLYLCACGSLMFFKATPRVNKKWVIAGISFFVLGILARYFRLIVQLNVIDGIPFVLFNFDSLLFYAGPILVLGGIFFLTKTLLKEHSISFFSAVLFFFSLLFYSVFLFGPNRLQVFNQRYLLIELFPFCLLGFCLWLQNVRTPAVRTALISFSFFWILGLTISLNKQNICNNTLEDYRTLNQRLDEQSSRRVAILVDKVSWFEKASIVPLYTYFGIPVVLGMPKNWEEYDYDFFRATSSPQEGHEVQFKNCHEYSSLFMGAPPMDLERYCLDLTFKKLPRKSVSEIVLK